MVYFLFFVALLFGSPVQSQDIIPQKKPLAFEKLIDNVSKAENAIILPPPLPNIKKAIESKSILIANGLPYPVKKPFVIAIATEPQIMRPQSQDDNVIIQYQGGGANDRMAGGGTGARGQVERRSAKPRIRLRETQDKSPFKTAKLPKAKALSSGDPVIIFFKEKSSDLEVGQLAILGADVLNRMKRDKGKTAAIYGYAENSSGTDSNELSLSRALMISDYLADHRIAKDRIEIRSMGADTPIKPKDRVDIIIY
jgi:outer membrane protein OmpA-like peptidoglycan-associated protein